MKRPYSTAVYNTATQEARICYVRAWDDPRTDRRLTPSSGKE